MSTHRFALPVAVHLLLFNGDKVLLLRRANTGYADGQWSVPAGHLDGGEGVVAAAVREAHEEIGIGLEPEAVLVVGVLHARDTDEYIHYFVLARTWTGTVRNAEPAKCDALRWYPLSGLPERMVPYVRRGLENALAGKPFDQFGALR